MVELGVLGFVLSGVLLLTFGRRLWSLLKVLAKYEVRRTYYCVSIAAFLIANIATFTVATQLYNDPFVLLADERCNPCKFSVPLI